ncbi:MAG TPA: cupin domain-containing protein [Herpetosiphonaceae bacterium]
MTDRQALVRAADEGRVIRIGPDEVILKLSAAETAGAYALLEFRTAPGSGAGPHVHHGEDEVFHILEGSLSFQLGDQEVTAGPGQVVMIPRGLRHSFRNPGPAPARSLIVFAPGGVEGFFAELAALLAAHPAGPPAADFVALGQRYRLEFSG